jgi:hypothetical protein
MNTRTGPAAGMHRAGGIAALYVVKACLAAIPYFVHLVVYPRGLSTDSSLSTSSPPLARPSTGLRRLLDWQLIVPANGTPT